MARSSSRLISAVLTVLVMAVMFLAGWMAGKIGIGAAVNPASLAQQERAFAERMRDVEMVGAFTVAGQEDRPPRPDRYTISSVEKVGDDRWRFNARLHYGGNELTLPVVVTMRWAGDTPMIMLTDFTIPTLGTFTVRVFFYGDRYAGIWQHGTSRGHMFGRIEHRTGQS